MSNLVIQIEARDGQQVTSSRNIADNLGKRHSHVVESIEKLLSDKRILENQDIGSLIIPTFYKVEGQRRSYKEYLLTKDGFILYMFNIQGYNDLKLAYINEFNRMKKLLSNPQPTFTRLYWNNQPVMTVEMFGNCLGVSGGKVNQALVKLGNNDFLYGNDLQEFKRINKDISGYSHRCSSLRFITYRVAIEVANLLNKSCDLFLKYYTVMEEKFKFPTEQMKVALEQARLLCMSYSQIRDRDIREAIGIQVTTILSNIGLWDKEIDSELDNDTLLGCNKRSIIQNNISGMKLLK